MFSPIAPTGNRMAPPEVASTTYRNEMGRASATPTANAQLAMQPLASAALPTVGASAYVWLESPIPTNGSPSSNPMTAVLIQRHRAPFAKATRTAPQVLEASSGKKNRVIVDARTG